MNDAIEKAITDSISGLWLNQAASTRRLTALREIRSRIDVHSLGALPPMILFSPGFCGGLVLRRSLPGEVAFLYLSPTLEVEFQVDVNFIVAHELAHVILGHGLQRTRTQSEVEADERSASDLVEKWRIPKRNPEDSRFLMFLETLRRQNPGPDAG